MPSWLLVLIQEAPAIISIINQIIAIFKTVHGKERTATIEAMKKHIDAFPGLPTDLKK
jgi:hypothetical protein